MQSFDHVSKFATTDLTYLFYVLVVDLVLLRKQKLRAYRKLQGTRAGQKYLIVDGQFARFAVYRFFYIGF